MFRASERDLDRDNLLPLAAPKQKQELVKTTIFTTSFSIPTMVRLLIALLLLFIVSTAKHASEAAPTGDVQCEAVAKTKSQGSFVGNRLTSANVDEYLGIPFAQAPINALRFAKTKPVKPYTGKALRNATEPGPICYQPPSTDSIPTQHQSEDCLQLNIYKPSSLKAGRNAPVMLWLYGGSWQEGSINEPRINATNFVKRSVELGEPIVWVAPNYRVGAFGFLAGKAIVDAQKRDEAVLNAGMWDQREALQWVQSNIEAFGGDPQRVTLFGESSGAINVGGQMMANEGKASKGLFRGAILQSGNAATGGRLSAHDAPAESTYSYVLQGAGCPNDTSSAEQIQCLKTVSSDKLMAGNRMAIANSYIAYIPVLDNFFAKQLPSKQWASGQYLRVPFITGDNLDEGTEFPYPTTVTNDSAFEQAQTFTLGSSITPILPQILKTWSADPTQGEPYRPDFFGVKANDTFYPPGDDGGVNQYKRQASMLQDVLFEAGRRMQLQSARVRNVRAWTYRFAQPSPVGVGFNVQTGVANASLGIQHEAEIPYVYANPPLQGPNARHIPEPLRTFASDANLVQVSNAMSAAWIHFANRLDPNGKDVPRWQPSASKVDSSGNGLELYIQAKNFSMTYDNLQNDQVQFVIRNKQYFAL